MATTASNSGNLIGSKRVDVSRNHYDVLEVNARTATPADIKRSFRRLCLKYHPDKSGPDGIGRFQEIKVAYDVLSDTLKKAQFDHIFFYSRGTVPFNAKRIAEPNASEPSSKRAKLETGTPDGQEQAGAASPSPGMESSVEGMGVSPPSDAGNSGDDGLSNLSIPELKALALERGINIAYCLEKSDMVTAIRRGRVVQAAHQSKASSTNAASSPSTSNRPSIHKPPGSSLLSQYWAFEREATRRQRWLNVSNESLNASTGLHEWMSWLRRVMDSSAAFITSAANDVGRMQDVADKERNSIGSEHSLAGLPKSTSEKFDRALEAHRRILTSSLSTFRRAQLVLGQLNTSLMGAAGALKAADADLVVAGRHMSGEMRRLKESASKIATSPDLMAEAQRYSAAASQMRSNLASDGVLPGVMGGQQRAPSSSPTRQATTPGGAVGQAHDGGVEGLSNAGGTSSKKQEAVDGVSPAGDSAAAKEKRPSDGTPSESIPNSVATPSFVTVRIPDSWRPGSKVRFSTDQGVVKFKPPSGCNPGDLMEYEPMTRKIRLVPVAAPPPPAVTASAGNGVPPQAS